MPVAEGAYALRVVARVLAGYIDNLPEVLFQTGTKRDELIANPVRAPHQLMN